MNLVISKFLLCKPVLVVFQFIILILLNYVFFVKVNTSYKTKLFCTFS
jgi:hypothetical protein